ncbi:MAG TPA: hypothetical protein VJX23_02875 [Candidatus Binataceae bacterium]|nr:hypothetical protein [Candidatus Binataceae bacterium]
MGEGLKRAVRAARRAREVSSADFITWWWAKRFPTAQPPTWDSAITCADASDLLECFRAELPDVAKLKISKKDWPSVRSKSEAKDLRERHPAEREIAIAVCAFISAREVARPSRFTLPELEVLHEQLEQLWRKR